MNLPLIVCAILGASSVLLGGYGAHGLVEKFSVFPKMKTAYENAVDYQMYHSLVILVLGVSSYIPRIKMPTYLWGSFTLSIVLFSFPIYIWVLGGPRWMVQVTPWGGIGFLVSWLLLVRFAWLNRDLK
jgi:uncharacterized membrane protein YgdD (TMEM256/DUF423 family)